MVKACVNRTTSSAVIVEIHVFLSFCNCSTEETFYPKLEVQYVLQALYAYTECRW